MSGTSEDPGYLRPTATRGLPGGLTLQQFIQTVIVGISGFPGQLVRPKTQKNPLKQPDIDVNWIAFEIRKQTPDANAWVGLNGDGTSNLTRQEDLEIALSFYGPQALEAIAELRDGFQVQQNLEAMRAANMGFKAFSEAVKSADLFNQLWYNRFEASLYLVRQVQRTYSVLPFASAGGIVHTVFGGSEQNFDWLTPALE